MPHYKDGTPVEVGDEVIFRGKIVGVTPSEDYCNATVELPPMPPYTTPYRTSINTKQLEKVSVEVTKED